MKTRSVDEHLKEKMKNPYFKELFQLEEQKFEVVKPIIEYRIKYKLNQGDLAKRAGVSQQHISKIESGEFSSIATLEKILLYIGYTIKVEAVPLSQKMKHQIEKLVNSKKRIQAA